MASTKTDNGDVEAKVLVRRAALEAAGPEPRVLDCYAGEGHMYRLVWSSAAEYLGMDKRFSRAKGSPDGACLRGRNEVLLSRAMAGATWNVVDLDAYGNPWPLLRRVLKLARAAQLVVTLTCGIDRSMRARREASDYPALIAGAATLSRTALLVRWYDDVIRWAIAWACAGSAYQVRRARVVQGTHNQQVRYWLLELARGGVASGPGTGPKTAG